MKVAFIELSVFSGVYPLASGYMRAVASKLPEVKEACTFEIHSICINDDGFEAKLDTIDADVYAISCYVWNMAFVRRWLSKLCDRKPNAHFILGGPQVMNHASRYLHPERERIVLCNGEGERTFAQYIRELLRSDGDLARVKGLSFYRSGELITNEPQPRIEDLSEVPSPYLEGYFEPGQYVWATLETNRGCPYQCTYCFWGAATNSRVYRADMDRVKDEITWLAKNRAFYVFITDANFGMLKRDVEIAEHFADCRRKHGYPLTVWLSAAKNSPERMTQITRIMSQAGLISTQPVSLQTMNPETLRSVKRSNIKESAYFKLQQDLHESKLASFVEMIWPLPGETLESFKAGLGKLCSSDADAILIHHLLLINNVPMNLQREEYQLQLRDDADPNSEAKVVIGTRDVSREEYKEGVRFGYHLTSLYNLRALRFLGRFLNEEGALSFQDLVTAFGRYCKRHPDHPYTQYVEYVIQGSMQSKFSANGGIFHCILHEFRREFDQLLHGFAREMGFLDDPATAFLFELDLLNRPHVYRNTPICNGDGLLEQVVVHAKEDDDLIVEVPEERAAEAGALFGLETPGTRLRITYRGTQMPFMANKPHEDNLSYCEGKLHKMGSILPRWAVAPLQRANVTRLAVVSTL